MPNDESAINDSVDVDVNVQEDQEDVSQGADDNGGRTPATSDKPTPNSIALEDYKKRLSAADRARVAAEKELNELKRAKMSEQERLQAEHDEAVEFARSIEEKYQNTLIENAFLASNASEFHNPKTALKLLDRSLIKIDDQGDVVGVDDAVKALKNSDPYLVKTEEKETKQRRGSTAPPAAPKGDSTKKPSDFFTKKYPALKLRR